MNEAVFTPRILNIPHALATKYARGNQERYEELVSEGNVALVKAAHDFDPSRGVLWSSFAYGRVQFVMRSYVTPDRHNKQFQWNTRRRDISAARDAMAKAESIVADVKDLADKTMRKIRCPVQRAIVQLRIVDGLGFGEIGDRTGQSANQVKHLYYSAVKQLKKWAESRYAFRKVGVHFDRKAPNNYNFDNERRRQNLEVFRQQKIKANRALGNFPVECYYLIDDGNRVVIGEHREISGLLAWMGMTSAVGGKSAKRTNEAMLEPLGLRLVTGREAREVFRSGFYSYYQPVTFDRREYRRKKG